MLTRFRCNFHYRHHYHYSRHHCHRRVVIIVIIVIITVIVIVIIISIIVVIVRISLTLRLLATQTTIDQRGVKKLENCVTTFKQIRKKNNVNIDQNNDQLTIANENYYNFATQSVFGRAEDVV